MSACTATTKAGQPCQAPPAEGETVCRLHSDAGAAGRAKGIAAARALREADAARLKLDTPEQVHAFVAETAARLRAGEIPAGTAVALDRLARTALAAIDSRLLEDAQAEIAASKAARPTAVQRRR